MHEDWATIIGQGTIGNLLTTISEGNAELARYLEYLYQEKKWRNARNMSSLTHLADLIAYKRSLPKSAIGFVIVSHNDINGISRLSNFGTTFFDLDQSSDYDNLTQNLTATNMEKSALVPWTADTGYIIPEGTIFKSGTGVSYFSVETVESRALKEPFSAIKANDTKYADFIKAGGWNGIKYLKIPVIQGEKRSVEFGTARGARFESFSIDVLNVENASNLISEKYFKVSVTPQIPSIGNNDYVAAKTEVWEPVIDIRIAGPYDKVFEYKILNNEDKVLIKFGDGITGQMLPAGALISCNYLETLGTAGNLEERYQIVQMVMPPGFNQIDPRFNVQTTFLECTNIVPIMGGKDIEDEDEIRVNAPPSYLQSYSIATKASYLNQIIKNSPINLLHCRIFQSSIYETESYGRKPNELPYLSNVGEHSVLQEVSMVRNALLVTAIRSNGTKLDSPETELIEPLIKAFNDRISPNDSFDYIEPNMVEIRPNIIVNTTETLTENEIKNNIMPQILDKYSIFNTDFEKPYYKTDIIDIVQNFNFSKYSSVFLEAKAKVNYMPTILSRVGMRYTAINDKKSLFAFKFNFDPIFAQNQLGAGFKNFTQKAPYLLRADILFRNEPTKNRSLFLFDNRTKLQDPFPLMEAENLPINENQILPIIEDTESYSNFENITFYNAYSENFVNHQVRTAQYNFIDRITSNSYVYQMKQFNSEPYEIRPLLLDASGKNKIFNVNEVPGDERVSFNYEETANILGQQCFRKNTQFIPRCKLLFNENYNMPKDQNYAYGYLIIPISYILTSTEISQFLIMFENYPGFEEMSEEFARFFNDQFTINVYAVPVQDEFTTENPFDILYSTKENILIQKNYLSSLS